MSTQLQWIEITCIVKPDHASGCEGITHIGNGTLRWTRQEAILKIEAPFPRIGFYTNVRNKVAIIRVVNGTYGKYLQTFADDYPNNSLLELNRCW